MLPTCTVNRFRDTIRPHPIGAAKGTTSRAQPGSAPTGPDTHRGKLSRHRVPAACQDRTVRVISRGTRGSGLRPRGRGAAPGAPTTAPAGAHARHRARGPERARRRRAVRAQPRPVSSCAPVPWARDGWRPFGSAHRGASKTRASWSGHRSRGAWWSRCPLTSPASSSKAARSSSSLPSRRRSSPSTSARRARTSRGGSVPTWATRARSPHRTPTWSTGSPTASPRSRAPTLVIRPGYRGPRRPPAPDRPHTACGRGPSEPLGHRGRWPQDGPEVPSSELVGSSRLEPIVATTTIPARLATTG